MIHEGGEKIDPEEGKASSSENLLVEIANVAWNRFRAKVRIHVLRESWTVSSWMVLIRIKAILDNETLCFPTRLRDYKVRERGCLDSTGWMVLIDRSQNSTTSRQEEQQW